jgi:putative NIF3 family GTP cyclohydrolase 1 type 2
MMKHMPIDAHRRVVGLMGLQVLGTAAEKAQHQYQWQSGIQWFW